MRNIKFSYSRTGAVRKHYLNEEDVQVLLSRLPEELWEKLRAVHFTDGAFGRRRAGYVTRRGQEITICAMPSRVSMGTFLAYRAPTAYRPHRSPGEFGAVRGCQWPELAVRRYLLYNTFLHELGHLQVVEPNARQERQKFAGEKKAQEFADYWREKLWSCRFDHPDPVHNQATREELEQLNQDSGKCVVQSTADGT